MPMKSKIDVTSAWHIALVKTDLDQSVEHFWKDLGIGPWQYIALSFPERTTRVYGKQVLFDIDAAMTQTGFLTFGIDKPPLTKPHPWEELLNKRGGGAHHLAFMVEDMEHTRKQMQSLGYREILSINGVGTNRDGSASYGDGSGSYFDTVEDMGTVIELAKPPAQLPGLGKVFPAAVDEVKRTSSINVRGAVHAGIVVRDVEKAARCYQEVFGFVPGKVVTFETPATYLGKETIFKVKAVLIEADTFVLELVQPLSSPNPLQDFLNKNGQGIHHFCLAVDDVRRSSEEMQRLGYAEVISAYNFGPNKDGEAAYFDTESALGIVIGLAKVPI